MGSREHDEKRRRAETERARPPRNESTVIDDDIRGQLDLDPDTSQFVTLRGEPARTTISAHDFSELGSPITELGSPSTALGVGPLLESASADDEAFSDLDSSDLSGNRSRTVAYSIADSAFGPSLAASSEPLGEIEEVAEAERTIFDGAAQPNLALDTESIDLAPDAPRATTPSNLEVERGADGPVPSGANVIPLFREAKGRRPAVEPESSSGARNVGERNARVPPREDPEPSKPKPRPAAAKGKRRPRGETIFDHLPRWLLFTDSAAKTLPMLIAAFVGVATLSIMGGMLLQFRTGEQQHVELVFLESLAGRAAKAGADRRPVLASLSIETEPPGILIVLDRKILGATPVTVDVPIASDSLGLELTGPYFEPFIGHATRSGSGAYSLRAKLIKRR